MNRRDFIRLLPAFLPVLDAARPAFAAWLTTGGIRYLEIGKAWAGAPVGFDALSADDLVFVAYYNEARWLTLATITGAGEVLERMSYDVEFDGWDSHKGIELAVDRDGVVHVVANMHGSPLVYLRGRSPFEVRNLARSAMVGLNEGQMTYPTFLLRRNSDLYFLYRDGVSGNGVWFCNRFDGQTWTRIGELPIFGNSGLGHSHLSAYPSNIVSVDDDWFYVAIMWRMPGNASLNYKITFIRTKDFLEWSGSDGRSVSGTVGPEQGDVIDESGPNSGLLNTHKLTVEPVSGLPVISFTKYTKHGYNGIYVAYLRDAHWHQQEVAVSPKRFSIEGQGSLKNVPGVGPVQFQDGVARISYNFPGCGQFYQDLDPESYLPLGAPEKAKNPIPTSIVGIRRDLPDRVVSFHAVRNRYGNISSNDFLLWSTQGPNNDLPRSCVVATPTACAPNPDTLKLVRISRP